MKTPFCDDTEHASYDGLAMQQFWQALRRVEPVFQTFHSRFRGKCSPVHFFWGSFDLAVTRFSGRRAPPHPGGVPNLPDEVTREAYSHEVSSAGFWPGNGGLGYAAFYCYAAPVPAGLAAKPPHLQAALALRAERAAGYAHARPTLKCAALRRGIAGLAPRALAVLRKTVAAVEPIGRWPLLV